MNELEIHCGECWPTVKASTELQIYQHIKAKHANYTDEEARDFAHYWAEDAFDRMEDERRETSQENRKAMLRGATWN